MIISQHKDKINKCKKLKKIIRENTTLNIIKVEKLLNFINSYEGVTIIKNKDISKIKKSLGKYLELIDTEDGKEVKNIVKKRLTKESGLIMGYDIIYEGKIKIDKPLDDRTYEIIRGLAETRRMIWDTKKLEADGIATREEIGFLGEYFFGIEGLNRKQKTEFENKYVIDHNRPPYGQPSLWGVWKVDDDKMGLVWNKNEKAYCGHEWLQYIVKTILVPRGYKPSGIINCFTQGEYYPKYHTIVKGNSVRKYRGYNKKQKEPDRKAWYDELSAEWEEYHQDWLKKLIENKVEFLHEREDYINNKSILSFNLYIGNDIVQVCFDRTNISESRYLYRNSKNNDGVIKYDEVNYDEKIEVDINTQNQARELIEKYITENPNFLDDSII